MVYRNVYQFFKRFKRCTERCIHKITKYNEKKNAYEEIYINDEIVIEYKDKNKICKTFLVHV